MTDYLARSITELKSLHVSVTQDLEHMPKFKVGTEWHTDRVREKEHLERKLAQLGVAF